MPPKRALPKKEQKPIEQQIVEEQEEQVQEIDTDEPSIKIPKIKNYNAELIKYFTQEEITFMTSQIAKSKSPNTPDTKITTEYVFKYFQNIYPLKLYSKNFQSDFIIAINDGLFITSLYDDMKKKEEDEIKFLTSKPQVSKGIKCPKCTKMYTYLQDKQVRSGDEGSDVFIRCLACGYYGKYN